MPVTISGTNGIQTPLGSAGSPVDSNTTTPTTGVYYPSATTWGVSTAGTNALYIDASQNVGIGTTSPGTYGKFVVQPSGNGYTAFTDSIGGGGGTQINMNYSGFKYSYIDTVVENGTAGLNASNLRFATAGSGTLSERMRIDSSGNLLVGTTSAAATNSNSIANLPGSGQTIYNHLNGTASGSAYVYFCYNGSAIASITQNGTTAVAYNTSSDYRLKENVTPMTTGLATISALKPVTYDWISDKSAGEGFIAHELQSVIPHAVTGEKDAVDNDGKPIYQGVDYSKVVVHLVAALQELKVEFDAYKAAHP
jgi:hypothetical protein